MRILKDESEGQDPDEIHEALMYCEDNALADDVGIHLFNHAIRRCPYPVFDSTSSHPLFISE